MKFCSLWNINDREKFASTCHIDGWRVWTRHQVILNNVTLNLLWERKQLQVGRRLSWESRGWGALCSYAKIQPPWFYIPSWTIFVSNPSLLRPTSNAKKRSFRWETLEFPSCILFVVILAKPTNSFLRSFVLAKLNPPPSWPFPQYRSSGRGKLVYFSISLPKISIPNENENALLKRVNGREKRLNKFAIGDRGRR